MGVSNDNDRAPGSSVSRKSRIAPMLLAVALAAPAAAQEEPLSFAFASQAGSGIYGIEGRVVQIYRIPVSFSVIPLEEDRRWGLSMNFPMTFGFYDYEPKDALHGEFPNHVGTASLLSGVEFKVRATEKWTLSPYVDLGAAKDFSGGTAAWVYDIGILSVVSFPAGTWDARAGQKLVWAGAAQSGDALTDWYGEAMVGFEFRHVLPWSSARSVWDLGLFTTYQHYLRQKTDSTAVSFAAPAPTSTTGVDDQTEIGFSFGTRPKLAWWKVSLPNLGLSYRFGDGIHGVRLIFGDVF
jgi:hypothetical protein